MRRRWPISTVTKQPRECPNHRSLRIFCWHLSNHQTHDRGQAHACLSITACWCAAAKNEHPYDAPQPPTHTLDNMKIVVMSVQLIRSDVLNGEHVLRGVGG